jgi:hypothetical protein
MQLPKNKNQTKIHTKLHSGLETLLIKKSLSFTKKGSEFFLG